MGGAWASVGMGRRAWGVAGARRRGQDGGMRLSIAWSPLYSGSNSKGWPSDQRRSDPIRSDGGPLANRGRDERGESFRIIGERPMIEMPIGGQLRQGP